MADCNRPEAYGGRDSRAVERRGRGIHAKQDQMLLLNPIRSKLLGAKKLWSGVGARQAIGGFPGMTAPGARVVAEQAGRSEQTEEDKIHHAMELRRQIASSRR